MSNDTVLLKKFSSIELLKTVYLHANVANTLLCKALNKGKENPSLEELATEGVYTANGTEVWDDYVFGKPIKCYLREHEGRTFLVRGDLYDRSHGEGQLLEAIRALYK